MINLKKRLLVIISILSIFPLFSFLKIDDYVEIRGKIVNSDNFKPVKHAKIYDINNNFLTSSDSKGYFNTKLKYEKNSNGIKFSFKVIKKGYSQFTQKENWAILHNIKGVYYIGLSKNSGNKINGFSRLLNNKMEYTDIKGSILLDRKISSLKIGNQKIFFKIDSKYFLINNSGWIELNSEYQNLIINKTKDTIIANQVNQILKRNQILSMSPSSLNKDFIEIYTK